jgi:hypothetical protein
MLTYPKQDAPPNTQWLLLTIARKTLKNKPNINFEQIMGSHPHYASF